MRNKNIHIGRVKENVSPDNSHCVHLELDITIHFGRETTKGDNNRVNVFTTCVQADTRGMMIELSVLKPGTSSTTVAQMAKLDLHTGPEHVPRLIQLIILRAIDFPSVTLYTVLRSRLLSLVSSRAESPEQSVKKRRKKRKKHNENNAT